MKKKTVANKIELSKFTITPVLETSVSNHSSQYGLGFTGICQPLGIIIESMDKRWGLDINGKRVDPDTLISPAMWSESELNRE